MSLAFLPHLPIGAEDIDSVSLNTSDGMLILLSAVNAVIMIGIAL